MSQPFLSVVVPTLRRPDTLRSALQTLVAQDYWNCEFVVQNNGHDSETQAVVQSFGDNRMRHFATSAVLPMTANWEVALSNAGGDAVTFIGDDDGLMPDACSIAASCFERHERDLLSWAPFWYFWPDYIQPEFRNRLLATINYDFFAQDVSSKQELSRVYGYEATYDRLPMIYNSFVHRRLIDRVRGRQGDYFVGLAPDVTSGLVNAAASERFARLSRPLSVTGTSRHSTGHLINYGGDEASRSASLRRDFRLLEEDPRLPAGDLLQVLLARDMLLVQDRLFPDDHSITFSYSGLMQAIGTTINDHPGAYEDLVAAISFIGSTHGIDPGAIVVPPPARKRSAPRLGVQRIGDGVVAKAIDGDAIGLRNVADAVALLAQLVPSASALDPELRAQADERTSEGTASGSITLQQVCDERLAVIERLEADLKVAQQNAAEQIALLQAVCEERLAANERLEADLKVAQQNAAEQIALLQAVCEERLAANERLASDLKTLQENATQQEALLRTVCEERLAVIERLELHLKDAQESAAKEISELRRACDERLMALQRLDAELRTAGSLRAAQEHHSEFDAQGLS